MKNEPAPSRALVALDGLYVALHDTRFTLRGHGREPHSLTDLFRASAALGVARSRIEDGIDTRLALEERARALSCVAPLPFGHHE